MKWRQERVPDWHLIALAILSLAVYGLAERSAHRILVSDYDIKIDAVKTAVLAQNTIRSELLAQGETIDPTNDPWETGLIGLEHSLITSDRGFVTAKILATNPNAAAAFIELLQKAHVHRGDRIAVGLTGSMPGWNIALLSACHAMGVTPVVIASIGASDFGANRPQLTWLDMERILREHKILPYKSVAASLGGGGDNGRGLSPEGRRLLREAITRNGVILIEAPTLEASIQARMTIYHARSGQAGYAAYVNIGGGIASVGGAYNNDLIPPGYSRRLPPANYPINAVVNRMSKEGVPIINLTSVRVINRRFGLPVVVGADPPTMGEGNLFFRNRIDTTLTTILTILLAIVVFTVVRVDLKHYVQRNPRPSPRDVAP